MPWKVTLPCPALGRQHRKDGIASEGIVYEDSSVDPSKSLAKRWLPLPCEKKFVSVGHRMGESMSQRAGEPSQVVWAEQVTLLPDLLGLAQGS